jgi:hypothetical protein
MSNARLYVNASNLFVITGYSEQILVDTDGILGMEYLSYKR